MGKIDINRAMRPKSDQLNADDLIAGPRTIRINDVRQESGGEERIEIHYDGDDNRPWKPAKTALRVLAAIWGDNPEKWSGMHCTIFCDPTVTWAGVAVGGVRVSHMEGLTQPRKMMLTKTRGKKAETIVQPLIVEKAGASDKWKERLFAVAEGQEMTVEEAWAKVPESVRQELDPGLYDQLQALEAAAQEHRENDPAAAVDALNASLESGE